MWKSSSLSKHPLPSDDSSGGQHGGAVSAVRVPWHMMIGCWLALAAFVLDRVTKGWARGVLRTGAPIELWPGVLRLTYLENTGAAFGMLQGRQTLLSIITGIILLALLVGLIGWGYRLPMLPRLGAWLLLGGALGNLYDRIAYGAVTDFIEIRLFSFPVFNVADICVCVAFVMLAGWVLFGKELKRDGG